MPSSDDEFEKFLNAGSDEESFELTQPLRQGKKKASKKKGSSRAVTNFDFTQESQNFDCDDPPPMYTSGRADFKIEGDEDPYNFDMDFSNPKKKKSKKKSKKKKEELDKEKSAPRRLSMEERVTSILARTGSTLNDPSNKGEEEREKGDTTEGKASIFSLYRTDEIEKQTQLTENTQFRYESVDDQGSVLSGNGSEDLMLGKEPTRKSTFEDMKAFFSIPSDKMELSAEEDEAENRDSTAASVNLDGLNKSDDDDDEYSEDDHGNSSGGDASGDEENAGYDDDFEMDSPQKLDATEEEARPSIPLNLSDLQSDIVVAPSQDLEFEIQPPTSMSESSFLPVSIDANDELSSTFNTEQTQENREQGSDEATSKNTYELSNEERNDDSTDEREYLDKGPIEDGMAALPNKEILTDSQPTIQRKEEKEEDKLDVTMKIEVPQEQEKLVDTKETTEMAQEYLRPPPAPPLEDEEEYHFMSKTDRTPSTSLDQYDDVHKEEKKCYSPPSAPSPPAVTEPQVIMRTKSQRPFNYGIPMEASSSSNSLPPPPPPPSPPSRRYNSQKQKTKFSIPSAKRTTTKYRQHMPIEEIKLTTAAFSAKFDALEKQLSTLAMNQDLRVEKQKKKDKYSPAVSASKLKSSAPLVKGRKEEDPKDLEAIRKDIERLQLVIAPLVSTQKNHPMNQTVSIDTLEEEKQKFKNQERDIRKSLEMESKIHQLVVEQKHKDIEDLCEQLKQVRAENDELKKAKSHLERQIVSPTEDLQKPQKDGISPQIKPHVETNTISTQTFRFANTSADTSTADAKSNTEQQSQDLSTGKSADWLELQKDLDQQQVLLQGYQKENEQLVKELYEMKATYATHQHQFQEEASQLNRQVNELRNQLHVNPETDQLTANFSEEEKRTKIENLNARLSAEAQVEELKEQVVVLKQELLQTPPSSSNLHLNASMIQEMKSNEEKMQQQIKMYAAQIQDLEVQNQVLQNKVSWYVENQELVNTKDAKLQQQQEQIQALQLQMTGTKSSSPDQERLQNPPNQNRNSSAADIRRILQLEKQLQEMEEALRKRNPDAIVNLIRATQPTLEEKMEENQWKRRALDKEKELEAYQEQMQQKIIVMRQEYHKVVHKYQHQGNDLNGKDDEDGDTAPSEEKEKQYQSMIHELKDENERMKTFYQRKIKENENKHEAKIRALKRDDKSSLSETAPASTNIKKPKIRSAIKPENVGSKKENHEHEEVKAIHNLKDQLQASESAREELLQVLQSIQHQHKVNPGGASDRGKIDPTSTAEMDKENHGQIKATEQLLFFEQAQEKYMSEMTRLAAKIDELATVRTSTPDQSGKDLEALRQEKEKLQTAMTKLNHENEDLKTISCRIPYLEDQLSQAKKELELPRTPSMIKFQQLTGQIEQLQHKQSIREQEISQILSQTQQQIQNERFKMHHQHQLVMSEKNVQISEFRQQLDSLLAQLETLEAGAQGH